MSKAEKTRQFIIEQTAEIFNKKGYNGTSLSDITSATGLTKGSIYGNFENKDDVAKEVYRYNAKLLRNSFINELNDAMTAREKIFAILDVYRKTWDINISRGGCPHLNTAIECDDTMPFLRTEVANNFQNWALHFCKILDEGKSKNEIVESAVSSEYAYQFIALIEGGILLSKTMDDKALLLSTLERIKKIIDTELIK